MTGPWTCRRCGFVNDDGDICATCDEARGPDDVAPSTPPVTVPDDDAPIVVVDPEPKHPSPHPDEHTPTPIIPFSPPEPDRPLPPPRPPSAITRFIRRILAALRPVARWIAGILRRIVTVLRPLLRGIARILAWLRESLAALFGALRWFFGWLRSIIDRVFGSPLRALWRLIASVARRIYRLVEYLVSAWVRIFERSDRGVSLRESGSETAIPLIAAIILAVTVYGGLWHTGLSTTWFVFATIVIWAVALGLATYMIGWPHASERLERLRRMLRSLARRTGCVWWERFGVAASLAFFMAAVRQGSRTVPVAAAIVVGFLALFGAKHEFRELRRGRARPTPPELPEAPESPELTDKGREDDLPEAVVLPADPDAAVHRRYEWVLTVPGRVDDHSLELYVDKARYELARDKNPGFGVPETIGSWVIDGKDLEVAHVARTLLEDAERRSYSTFAEISNALAFAQSIRYELDEVSTGRIEYWRFPIETLHDECGDCEDSSILAAALLDHMGHDVIFIFIPDHVAIGVEVAEGLPGDYVDFEGRRYYFCETTSTGWRMGDVPSTVRSETFTPIPIRHRAGR